MKKLSLRELQLVTLDILKYFDKVCAKIIFNIHWSGGTMVR